MLDCVGGEVTRLYVLESDCVCLRVWRLLTEATSNMSQGHSQQQIDWIYCAGDWTVVFSHFVVRCRVEGRFRRYSSLALTRNAPRYLYNNTLTGQIPSTIGKFTALTDLYVVVGLCTGRIGAHTVACRRLFNNNLTGPIPETIGQMTALTVLYVC